LGGPDGIKAQSFEPVFLQCCWLGHLTRKNSSRYVFNNVFGVTLSLSQSITQSTKHNTPRYRLHG